MVEPNQVTELENNQKKVDDAMETMTPSKEMTDGQIDKAVDSYRAVLRKHRSELGSENVQYILGQPEYVAEQVLVLRRRVESVSEMIVRHFKIDPNKSPNQMITALGRKEYVNVDVLSTMPAPELLEGDLYFFPVKKVIPVAEYDREFEIRGLVPHPYAQIQVNADDQAFADEHPNGVQWKDKDGNICCAYFDRWLGERKVDVNRYDNRWDDGWWFAGVRKDIVPQV